ncbi:hypothetical protein B0H17DRAFT_1148195 [Mycena rosella]|uniref:Uncharacterized protein n=1 Tax=Mycena rosella TaxID=1033263 RepID=A0AAD7CDF1_MYCRO|nr:hypothetical protein B0H17DRAFT_1148195 [Mycena rosella]
MCREGAHSSAWWRMAGVSSASVMAMHGTIIGGDCAPPTRQVLESPVPGHKMGGDDGVDNEVVLQHNGANEGKRCKGAATTQQQKQPAEPKSTTMETTQGTIPGGETHPPQGKSPNLPKVQGDGVYTEQAQKVARPSALRRAITVRQAERQLKSKELERADAEEQSKVWVEPREQMAALVGKWGVQRAWWIKEESMEEDAGHRAS